MSVKDDLENKLRVKRARDNKLQDKVIEVIEDSEIYNTIVKRLIGTYASELDSFSDSMDSLVRDIRTGVITKYSDLQLEMRCIVLAQALHKAAEGLGIIGGQSDVARMSREHRFAEIYKNITSGTIPDKKAQAEEHVMDEKQVEAVFQRAYQSLASKVKSGNRILEAVKKVLSSRMIAYEVFRKELADEMNTEWSEPEDLISGEEIDDGTD